MRRAAEPGGADQEIGNELQPAGQRVADGNAGVDHRGRRVEVQGEFLSPVHELPALVVGFLGCRELFAFLRPFQTLVRFLDLLLAYGLHRVQQADLLALAQQAQTFGVSLLQRREQRAAERLHVVAQLVGLLQQDVEAIERQRSVQVREDGADVHPGSHGLDQRARIDGRRKQRQLPRHAFEVHAVADLVEAVGHGVPNTEELVVLRDAEIQRRQGRGVRAGRAAPGCDRDEVLHLHQGVGEGVELGLQLVEGFDRRFVTRWHFLRPGPEDLRRQHVELRRLVDALHGVLLEEVVSPANEIVHVIHHHGLLVRHRTVVGDAVRIEGVRAPVDDLLLELRVARHGPVACQHPQEVLDALLHVLRVGGLEKRLGDPIFSHRGGSARGVRQGLHSDRIEDVVIPVAGLGEALLAAQRVGDQQRGVEEQFPVAVRVGAIGREIDVLPRVELGVRVFRIVGQLHHPAGWLIGPEEREPGILQLGRPAHQGRDAQERILHPLREVTDEGVVEIREVKSRD